MLFGSITVVLYTESVVMVSVLATPFMPPTEAVHLMLVSPRTLLQPVIVHLPYMPLWSVLKSKVSRLS